MKRRIQQYVPFGYLCLEYENIPVVSCKNGYEADSSNPTFNCNPLCTAPNKWYYDNTGSRICLNGSDCPSFKNILIELTYQCVESCLPTGTCELCQTEDLYEEAGKCIESCQNSKIKNISKHI